jgi:hypothetical protein
MEKKVDNPISLEWKSVTNGNLIDSETVNVISPGFDNLEDQQQNHLTYIKQINIVQEDMHVRRASARSKKIACD